MTRKIRQFGLRRSGLHAIVGWLHHHDQFRAKWYQTSPPCPTPQRLEIADLLCFENVPTEAAAAYMKTTPHFVFVHMRDPYNWLASRMTFQPLKTGPVAKPEYIRQCVTWWEEYAEHCLHDTWPGNPPWVNFREWFLSKKYRIACAKSLGFETDGAPNQEVLPAGRGSSFTQRSFNGTAQTMPVLERYRMYQDTPEFRGYVTDKMVDLGKALFDVDRPW